MHTRENVRHVARSVFKLKRNGRPVQIWVTRVLFIVESLRFFFKVNFFAFFFHTNFWKFNHFLWFRCSSKNGHPILLFFCPCGRVKILFVRMRIAPFGGEWNCWYVEFSILWNRVASSPSQDSTFECAVSFLRQTLSPATRNCPSKFSILVYLFIVRQEKPYAGIVSRLQRKVATATVSFYSRGKI